MCICVYLSVCMYTACTQCLMIPERTLDPLEPELHTVVSCLMWVLGTKAGSSGGAGSAVNLGVVSPAPKLACFIVRLYVHLSAVVWNTKTGPVKVTGTYCYHVP